MVCPRDDSWILLVKNLFLSSLFIFDRPCQHFEHNLITKWHTQKINTVFFVQNIGNVGQWTCRKKVNKENYNKAVMSQNLLNCMNCFESIVWITNYLAYNKWNQRKSIKNICVWNILNVYVFSIFHFPYHQTGFYNSTLLRKQGSFVFQLKRCCKNVNRQSMCRMLWCV